MRCCYQEVVVDERPGLPGDHLRPLRAALAQPLAAPMDQLRSNQIWTEATTPGRTQSATDSPEVAAGAGAARGEGGGVGGLAGTAGLGGLGVAGGGEVGGGGDGEREDAEGDEGEEACGGREQRGERERVGGGAAARAR